MANSLVSEIPELLHCVHPLLVVRKRSLEGQLALLGGVGSLEEEVVERGGEKTEDDESDLDSVADEVTRRVDRAIAGVWEGGAPRSASPQRDGNEMARWAAEDVHVTRGDTSKVSDTDLEGSCWSRKARISFLRATSREGRDDIQPTPRFVWPAKLFESQVTTAGSPP